MVAAVRVSSPQKVWAPWRASPIRSVISAKVVSIRLRHWAMIFRRMGGLAWRWLLAGGGEDGGAAGRLSGGERGAGESLVQQQVPWRRPGRQQVVGHGALG
jgi:hypothetical protein